MFDSGDTALLAASRADRTDTLAVLLDSKIGGDVNAVNSRTGGTALHVAANKGLLSELCRPSPALSFFGGISRTSQK